MIAYQYEHRNIYTDRWELRTGYFPIPPFGPVYDNSPQFECPDFGRSRCPTLCKFLGGLLCPGPVVTAGLLTSGCFLFSGALFASGGGSSSAQPMMIGGSLGLTVTLIYSLCSGIANVNRDNLNRSALMDCIVRVITGAEAIQTCDFEV